MSVLKPGDVSRFIAGQTGVTSLCLIYGPDEGLVRTRVKALAMAVVGSGSDALAVLDVDAESINPDPARLLDEANSIGMFGGKRAIVVRQAGRLLKAAWQPLLDIPPLDSFVIFQGEDLSRSAAIRVACEASAHAAVIACYPPSLLDIQGRIDGFCREAGLSITPVARAFLAELLGSDYALSDGELAKLVLHCHGKLAIELADIEAVVTDSSGAAGHEPVDRAFEGRLEEVEGVTLRSFREGINPSGLLTLALSHAMLLRRLAIARLDGSGEGALRTERLFFKRVDRVKAQSVKWDIPLVSKAIETLATAQEQCRRAPHLEETITIRALWALALASRRR